MAIDYAKLFQNPEALGLMSPEEMGLVDPEAFRQLQEQVTLSQTPVQPEVTAQAIRPDMSQEEMQKQLYTLLGQSFTEQSKQIEQLRAQAAKERELQDQMGALGRLDIRPFAQAVRGYGATNVAVPEEAPKDRTEILNKLEQAISSAQQGMTRDQVLALRNMMESKQREGQDRRLETSLRGAAFREMKEGITPFIKLNDVAETAIADFKPMERIFAQKEIPIKELTTIITKFGKRMGEVGAQSEGDRKAYWDPDLGTSFLSAIQKVSGTKQTISRDDPNVQAMINAMNDSKEAMAQGLSSKGEFMTNVYGTPDSPIGYMFQKGKQGDIANQKLQTASEKIKSLQFDNTQTSAGIMSEAQKKRLQELRAKHGK